jgi:hypothetical protein
VTLRFPLCGLTFSRLDGAETQWALGRRRRVA